MLICGRLKKRGEANSKVALAFIKHGAQLKRKGEFANVLMNEWTNTVVTKSNKLGISIDPRAEIPIYVQLKNQLRYLIQSGVLRPGEQMPTVRELAVDLAINANTVARVYADLEAEGIIERVHGKGTFVASKIEPRKATDKLERARELIAGTIKSLRGMELSDFEIRDLLKEMAENLIQS